MCVCVCVYAEKAFRGGWAMVWTKTSKPCNCGVRHFRIFTATLTHIHGSIQNTAALGIPSPLPVHIVTSTHWRGKGWHHCYTTRDDNMLAVRTNYICFHIIVRYCLVEQFMMRRKMYWAGMLSSLDLDSIWLLSLHNSTGACSHSTLNQTTTLLSFRLLSYPHLVSSLSALQISRHS